MSITHFYWRSSGRTLLPAIFVMLALAQPASLVQEVRAQERPVFEVGILVDTLPEDLTDVLDQMEREIIAVVGGDAEVRFPDSAVLVNGFDPRAAAANYETLTRSTVDLILAFGPVNNQVVWSQETHRTPTILFGSVNSDLVELERNRVSSGITNFTYLISSNSYARDLETLHSIQPFHRAGVVMSGPLADDPAVREALEATFSRLQADFELIRYQGPADLESRLERLDAVYVAEGFGIPEAEMEQLADMLRRERVASFTNTQRSHVESGWLATLQTADNFQQFFRRLALTVEDFINGAALADLPIYYQQNEILTLNFNTAEEIGVPIPYSLLSSAEFVGDFERRNVDRRYALLEVLNEALAGNPSILASRVGLSLAEFDVGEARSAFRPSLTGSATSTYTDPELAAASGGRNPEYSTSGNVTLSQTIYSEAARTNVAVQRDLQSARREDLSAEELDLVADAADLYFNLLALKANLKIQKQNLDVTRSNLRLAVQNFESGLTGESDVLRFRSEMARNMQALIDAANELERAFEVMNLVLGAPVGRRIDVSDVTSPDEVLEGYDFDSLRILLDDPAQRSILLEFLVGEALNNAPELTALEHRISVTRRQVRLNGVRRFIPSVGTQAQYNRTFDQSGAGSIPEDLLLRENYFVGVTLSVPLFDRNLERINRQRGLLQEEQLKLNRGGLTLAIEQAVRSAVLALSGELAGMELSKVSSDAAARSLELTEAAYGAGAVGVVALLDAQNASLQAQIALSNATYGFLSSAIALEREVGHFSLLSGEGEALNARFFQFLSERLDAR